MEKPLVSIVCDCYNHEKYIRDALDGFIMQKTTFAFEVLIHDDASSDKSKEIIEKYAEEYPDIIFPIYQEVNQYSQGISIWKNYQFSRAKGKYIALCEGDDYWTDPYKLQKQVDFLEANEEYGLVYTDIDMFYQVTKNVEAAIFRNGLSLLDDVNPIRSSGYLGNASWVFRVELIKHVDIYAGCTDGALNLFYELAQNSKVFFLPDVTATYRISTGTTSRPTEEIKQYQYYKGILNLQLKFVDKYKIKDEISCSVLMNLFLSSLPAAVKFEDDVFILDAKVFFEARGVIIEPYLNICRKILDAEHELRLVHVARSYRLGKFILKLFKPLKILIGLKGKISLCINVQKWFK